ncbi:MAG: FHA domain-containing protein [bacterium]|nr:FHA domain-containing protein [bacterium]
MNLQKCSNGHFYDTEKYASCPHCAGASTAEQKETVVLNNQSNVETMALTHPFSPLSDAVSDTKSTPSADSNVTIGYYSGMIGSEPVVGWLVCIEGDYFGESFKLKSGRNFIGRASHMDISLSGDVSVSREKHAIVVYEPKSRTFIAQPGESSELFYLNDEVVLNTTAMKVNDVLSIGKTKLMLIPCCSKAFSWDDYMKDGEK